MKSLSSNILSFVQLSSIIEKQKKEESLVKEAFGLDPISRTVNGMVKMASAYDVLAKSIKNLSGSINSLNVEKISSFNSLTGNIAIMSAMDSNMFNNMLSVLEKRSNVFSKLLDAKTLEIGNRPSVNVEPLTLNKNKQFKTDSKGENDLQKLDKIITILTEMNRNVVTIDKFLKDKDDGLGSNNDIK